MSLIYPKTMKTPNVIDIFFMLSVHTAGDDSGVRLLPCGAIRAPVHQANAVSISFVGSFLLHVIQKSTIKFLGNIVNINTNPQACKRAL
jgi:hypothetical protein